MNWKFTALLLVVAAALIAYFKFYEEKQLGTEDKQKLADRPVIVDRSQVDGLAITNHDLKIDLRRNSAGQWDMKSPIADRADVALIDQVMTELETMHTENTIPASEIMANKGKLQEFGLQTPRLRLQVTPRGGSPSNELDFGNDTVIEGKTYLQVAGHNEVYVISSKLKKLIDKEVNVWRDHRLTETPATDVNRITVKNPAGELELQRQGEHWQITRPLNARASDQKVNDLASQLTNTTISSFVADDKADAATYGLADPRGIVTLYTAQDLKGTELIVGSPKAAAPDKNNPAASAIPAAQGADGTVYLRMPARQSIYTVARGIEDFLNLKPNDVRDRQLVRLNPDMVDRIKITPAQGTPVVLARKDKNWTLLGAPADQPANGAEADRLMQGLSQATVAAFVADSASDLAKYGLDKPPLKVAFSSFASENTAESGAGEKPLATISFGKAGEPASNVYARVEEEPFILSVPRTVLEAIPADPALWQPLNIFQADPEKIGSVSISAQGQPELGITRTDKSLWTLTKGTGPLDQVKAQSVANTLAKLHATRWVAEALPADAGLEPAPAFATLRFETAGDARNNGVLLLGHTSAENMGYARVEGKPGTFLISRPDYDTLLQPLVPAPALTLTPVTIPAATPTPTATPVETPVPSPAAKPVSTPEPAATPIPSTPVLIPEVTPIPTLPATEPTPSPTPTAG